MTTEQSAFLKEVFKEANGHIRATDRKALTVTAVYVGLFSVFLATFGNGGGMAMPSSPWAVLLQLFFLLVGTSVYVLQCWYRAWKEHYLEICGHIRDLFIDEAAMPHLSKCLPCWMHCEFRISRISVDNILQYLVLLINSIIVAIVSFEILNLADRNSASILAIIIGVLAYSGIVITVWRHIHKKNLSHV